MNIKLSVTNWWKTEGGLDFILFQNYSLRGSRALCPYPPVLLLHPNTHHNIWRWLSRGDNKSCENPYVWKPLDTQGDDSGEWSDYELTEEKVSTSLLQGCVKKEQLSKREWVHIWKKHTLFLFCLGFVKHSITVKGNTSHTYMLNIS